MNPKICNDSPVVARLFDALTGPESFALFSEDEKKALVEDFCAEQGLNAGDVEQLTRFVLTEFADINITSRAQSLWAIVLLDYVEHGSALCYLRKAHRLIVDKRDEGGIDRNHWESMLNTLALRLGYAVCDA